MNVNYELKLLPASADGAGRVWFMGDGGNRQLKRREIQIPLGDAQRMGERLRTARERADLSQDALATALGCSGAMVSKMEKFGAGSIAGWRQACKILRVSMDYVVMLDDSAEAAGLTNLLAANRAMTEQVATMERDIQRLRRERDELLVRVTREKP